LAVGDDLAGLGKHSRDNPVGIGLEIGIVELVVREIERALGTLKATFGLILGRLLAIEVGDETQPASSAWYSVRGPMRLA
jgi:hypothetical protein